MGNKGGLALIAFSLITWACASRSYTHYLVSPPVVGDAEVADRGTPLRPYTFGSTKTMKVRWNDGQIFTEVDIPLLSSGQRVIIEHGRQDGSSIPVAPATRVVPPPPSPADQTLADAYRERGLPENRSAPDASILRTRALVKDAIRLGNYTLALEYVELVLARFPSHPEFLRTQGSILLLLGERDKAIEVYEKAEDIETDPAVRRKLEELYRAR